MRHKNMAGRNVAGVGAAVTGLGALIGGPWGAGIAGFGLAHITLGLLSTSDFGKRMAKGKW